MATLEYAAPIPLQDGNLFSSLTGAPTFSTSGLRSGGGSAKMICTAAGATVRGNMAHAAGKRVIVDSFYYLHTAAASTNSDIWTYINATANVGLSATTAGALRAHVGVTSGTSSAALTNNQWYRIDVRVAVSGGNVTIDWMIDGAAQSQLVVAQTDADLTETRMGPSSSTYVVHIMDHAGSYTSGDYPLGQYKANLYDLDTVVGANHSLGSGAYQKTGAVAITSGDTNSQAELTEKPMSVTQYVAQTAIAATTYLEYPVADSAETVPPDLVRVGIQFSGSAGGGYTFELRAFDGTSEGSDLTTGQTKTATTARSVLAPLTPPSGGSWTDAKFDALRFRFGFSSDATPNPRLSGLAVMAVFPVVVTVSGAAALANTAALTATGQRTALGAAALSESAVLTASGVTQSSGSAALTSTGVLAASGVVTRSGSAALTASDALTASGLQTVTGQAALTESAVLTATGTLMWESAAALTSTSLLAATGVLTTSGAADLVMSEELTADGHADLAGMANLAGGGVLTATGVVVISGEVHLVTPDPVPPIIIVERSGGGSPIRITLRPVYASAYLYARGTLTATGYVDDEQLAAELALQLLA